MTRLSKFITVFALVLTLGGHWALLQSAAWVSMFVSNAQHDSWQLALNKTFDGQHPCALCHVVAQGQHAEQEQPQGFTVEKFELFLAEPEVFVFLEPSAAPLPPPEAIDLGRAEQPPTPPPRAFLSACLIGRPAVGRGSGRASTTAAMRSGQTARPEPRPTAGRLIKHALSRCHPVIWGTAAEAALAGVSFERAARAGVAAPAFRPGWRRGFPYDLFSFSPIYFAAAMG